VGCCCLSGGSSGHGRPRLAKLLADDMRKGGGLVPRMLPGPGLEFGPDLRAAQFACNIIAGYRRGKAAWVVKCHFHGVYIKRLCRKGSRTEA